MKENVTFIAIALLTVFLLKDHTKFISFFSLLIENYSNAIKDDYTLCIFDDYDMF